MARRLALVLFGLLAAAAFPAAASGLEERLPARPGGRLEVDLDLGIGLRPDRGSLRVGTHDLAEVRIEAESSGWGSWSVVFEVEPEAGNVRLVGRVEGATSWMFGGPRVQVRVWVPEDYDVDLRTTAGPILVERVRGGVRARVEDGSIELRNTRGPAKLRTTQGPIEVDDVVGALDAKTSEGRIEISRIEGDVRARTTYGGIEMSEIEGSVNARVVEGSLELLDVRGPAVAHVEVGSLWASFAGDPAGALETGRGPLEVRFASDAGTDLDARALEGSLELDAGMAVDGEQSEARAVGRINGGGAPLWLRTASGRIRVGRR